TMASFDDVTVLVPTYNEAETVGQVVDDFREVGFDDILVIDGDSTDETERVAADHGARVIAQSGTGKGQAVREAVERHIDRTYILMLDGDATYHADDAEAMLEPLFDGDASHVVGNRFADLREDAMTQFNQIGNSIINWGFRAVHGDQIQDILSGYRAFTRASFHEMTLTADGFGIETEMAVECARRDIPTATAPITYYPRPSGSETNLRPVRDGGIIFLELFRQAKTNNPLFYFGSVGAVSTLTGLGVAVYVVVEWITVRVPHEILAVVAAAGVLFGVQLLMFGVLADLIYSLHSETMSRIESTMAIQQPGQMTSGVSHRRDSIETDKQTHKGGDQGRNPPAWTITMNEYRRRHLMVTWKRSLIKKQQSRQNWTVHSVRDQR
ncbi:MAG: glycosyltransferase, TIGR04182 family, partial [Haloquadratum walsbyi J07HQW2]